MSATSDHIVFVLASANPDKAKEMREILVDALAGVADLRDRPLGVPPVDEVGQTLEDNARLKAVAVCQATGLSSIADDTGLEVVALGGRPGVETARFAGPDADYGQNVRLLLSELEGATDRRARFRTVALAVTVDGTELVAEGSVDGTIALHPAGTGGFGYDPVFVPDGSDGRTLAEMEPGEKHAISHRGRAFRALAAEIRSRLDADGLGAAHRR